MKQVNENQIQNYIKNYMPFAGGALIKSKDSTSANLELSDKGFLLTMRSIGGLFSSLSDLLSENIIEIEEVDCSKPITQIGKIFNKNKTDKAGPHRYDIVYEEIFSNFDRESKLNILEIGLGTNNPKIVSNIGRNGRVGASLFSYQEYFVNSNIFGADVDRTILFNKENIKTSYVDQLEIKTFEQMHKNLGSPTLDIFIEDGLHSVTASLNSLNYGLKHVRKGGFIILEDLANRDRIWQSIATIVKHTQDVESIRLISAKGTLLVIKI